MAQPATYTTLGKLQNSTVAMPAMLYPATPRAWARRTGVGLDDYVCHLLAAWSRQDPTECRSAWKRVLLQAGMTVQDCNDVLAVGVASPRHRAMSFFLVWTGRHYHSHLRPEEAKALALALRLRPADLADRLGLEVNGGQRLLPPVMLEIPSNSLSHRIAVAAHGELAWLELVLARLPGSKNAFARQMAAALKISVHSCAHTLNPTQAHARCWNPAKVRYACRALGWPLKDAARAMGVPPYYLRPRRHWPRLSKLAIRGNAIEGWRRRRGFAPLALPWAA